MKSTLLAVAMLFAASALGGCRPTRAATTRPAVVQAPPAPAPESDPEAKPAPAPAPAPGSSRAAGTSKCIDTCVRQTQMRAVGAETLRADCRSGCIKTCQTSCEKQSAARAVSADQISSDCRRECTVE